MNTTNNVTVKLTPDDKFLIWRETGEYDADIIAYCIKTLKKLGCAIDPTDPDEVGAIREGAMTLAKKWEAGTGSIASHCATSAKAWWQEYIAKVKNAVSSPRDAVFTPGREAKGTDRNLLTSQAQPLEHEVDGETVELEIVDQDSLNPHARFELEDLKESLIASGKYKPLEVEVLWGRTVLQMTLEEVCCELIKGYTAFSSTEQRKIRDRLSHQYAATIKKMSNDKALIEALTP